MPAGSKDSDVHDERATTGSRTPAHIDSSDWPVSRPQRMGKSLLAHGSHIGPLNAFKGAHVATIVASDIRSLARLADVWPDAGARDQDAEPWNVTPPRGAGSFRVAVYVSRNPQAPLPGGVRLPPTATDARGRGQPVRSGECICGADALGRCLRRSNRRMGPAYGRRPVHVAALRLRPRRTGRRRIGHVLNGH